jgi:hypothetical protein
MMKPLTVEVISHWASAYGNCAPCELILKEAGVKMLACDRDIADYPAELKEEMTKLGSWLDEICRLYRHRIRIRLIDAYSPLGFYKALIHHIRRYPAFIIERKEVYSGWDRNRVEEILDARLKRVHYGRA